MTARARALSCSPVMGARPGRVPLAFERGLAAATWGVVSARLARETRMTTPANRATASLALKQGSVRRGRLLWRGSRGGVFRHGEECVAAGSAGAERDEGPAGGGGDRVGGRRPAGVAQRGGQAGALREPAV